MAILKCKNCGRTTNSTVSEIDWSVESADVAIECYAAFVDGKWIKGCAYDKLKEGFEKKFVDKVIGKKKGGNNGRDRVPDNAD